MTSLLLATSSLVTSLVSPIAVVQRSASRHREPLLTVAEEDACYLFDTKEG